MKLRYILFIAIVMSTSLTIAQTPMPVNVPDGAQLRLSCNGDQEAGSVSLGDFSGLAQSNDIDLDRMYLCAGDRVPILHNGDALLNGDPQPGTPAGVGYGFYNCQPTIGGENLTDVAVDPCFVNDPNPDSDFFVASEGRTDFGITLNNDGTLIENFNGGDPASYFFAPITFDALNVTSGGTFQPVYEAPTGDPMNEGPCVDVSADEAFEVVYLAQFSIENISSSEDNGRCIGSFNIFGGLPEFELGANYNISIYAVGNQNLTGDLQGSNYSHGDLVEFEVPIGGQYIVEVSDGKNCAQTFEIAIGCGDNVVLNIPEVEVMPGESFCVPITIVSGFDAIGGFQFTVKFDPNIITYDNFQNFDIPKNNGLSFIRESDSDQGILSILWLSDDALNGTTLNDGTVIVEFCFTANPDAQQGDMSPIFFDNQPVQIEMYNSESEDIGLILDDGKVTINSSNNLIYSSRSCGSETGQTDGAIYISAFNGSMPYTIDYTGPENGSVNLGPGESEATIENLPPGTYTVTLTDNAGDTYVNTVTITSTAPVRPSFDFDIENPSCAGRRDGELEIINLNSQNPTRIEWSTGNFNTPLIEDLIEGNYSVTVTDQFGCEVSDSRVLVDDKVTLDTDITNASCTDALDGEASVRGIGGTPFAGGFYDYEWSNGFNDPMAGISQQSNLGRGKYFVSITDAQNCESVDSFVIGVDKDLFFDPFIIEDVSCFGAGDGRISGMAVTESESGDSDPPYTINVRNQSGTVDETFLGNSFDMSNLGGGTFDITLMDSGNPACTFDTTITIQEPDELLVSANFTNESCSVGDDGTISLDITGGTPDMNGDYQIMWDNGLPPQDSVFDLSEGFYSVTVTDENGCSSEINNIEITTPSRPRITGVDSVQISCNGADDGILWVNYEETDFPIERVVWRPGLLEGDTIRNVSPGFYEVEVIDEGGCSDRLLFYFSEPEPIDTSSIFVSSPTCVNTNDGRIVVSMEGGTPPYEFTWNDPDIGNTNIANNLLVGTYTVTVTDANNCPPVVLNIELDSPDPLEVEFTNINGTSCSDECDGRAIANASGGINGGPYTYEWNNGVTDAANNMLCGGENFVIVSDGNCTDTFFIDIDSPSPLSMQLINEEMPTCFGRSDGSLEITGSSGTPGYIYSWSTGDIGSSINNLTSGSYTVTIVDNNGCELDTTLNLEEPDSLVVEIDSSETVDETCFDSGDARVSLDVEGGNAGGYSYNWNPDVSTTDEARNISNGFYHVTVTDSKGCTDTTSYLVESPEEIIFDIVETEEILCNGEQASLSILNTSGGAGGPYTASLGGVEIDNLADFQSPAGSYTLTVRDRNNCRKDTIIEIEEPEALEILLNDEYELTLGDSLLLQPEVINQTSPLDSISWTPPSAVNCDSCLFTYVEVFNDIELTISVIDENGCIGEKTTYIRVDKSRNVYIPNAFTPNGDGINDVFQVYTGPDVQEIEYFRVFDRWGMLVYESFGLSPLSNGSAGWDGFTNGDKCMPGVYTYSVNVLFKDGGEVMYQGDVTIVDSGN